MTKKASLMLKVPSDSTLAPWLSLRAPWALSELGPPSRVLSAVEIRLMLWLRTVTGVSPAFILSVPLCCHAVLCSPPSLHRVPQTGSLLWVFLTALKPTDKTHDFSSSVCTTLSADLLREAASWCFWIWIGSNENVTPIKLRRGMVLPRLNDVSLRRNTSEAWESIGKQGTSYKITHCPSQGKRGPMGWTCHQVVDRLPWEMVPYGVSASVPVTGWKSGSSRSS